MDKQALIDEFRSRLEDTLEPYLWSDPEVNGYLTRAEREACVRARLIEDNTTAAVCEIVLVAGQRRYSLHASIDILVHAKLDGRQLPIVSMEDLDNQHCDWETRTGMPHSIVREGEHAIVLDRAPTSLEAGKIIRIRTFRFPLIDLGDKDLSEEPEIRGQHHDGLFDWLAHEAYLKKDAETYDPVKAAEHEARFGVRFGARPNANVRRKHRDRKLPATRFNPDW